MKRCPLFILIGLSALFAACSLTPGDAGAVFALRVGSVGASAAPDGDPSRSSARFLPSEARSLDVHVTGDGFDRSYAAQLQPGGTSMTIDRLPIDVDLRFDFKSLDQNGATVTQGSLTQRLKRGRNSGSVRLLPLETAIASVSVDTANPAAMLALNSMAGLGPGDMRFFEVTFNQAGEYQLLAMTKDTRYARLELFDAEWNPVSYVCSDSKQGWGVVSVAANDKIRAAVTSRYSGQTITLEARSARFVAQGGGGGGTSSNPYGNFLALPAQSASVFVKDGSYTLMSSITLDGNRVNVYGGFSASDWKIRDTSAKKTKLTGESMDQVFSATGTVATEYAIVDGFSVNSDSTGSVPTSYAINYLGSGHLIVSNCSISGPNYSDSDISPLSSYGIQISNGNVEIAHCEITGGLITRTAQGTTNNSTTVGGINIISSGSAYIHDCEINGGFSWYDNNATPGTMNAFGISASSSSGVPVIITRCRIFGGSAGGNVVPNGTANSYGLNFMGSGSSAVVTNSLISAGYAQAEVAYCYGARCVLGSVRLVGNTIGSGICRGSSSMNPYTSCVYMGNSTVTVVANGNACIVYPQVNAVSSAFSKAVAGSFTAFDSAENVTFGTTTPYDPSMIGSNPTPFAPGPFPITGNNASENTSPTVAFKQYDISGIGLSASDGSAWLNNNDWHPAVEEFSGQQNWISQVNNYLASYPGMLVDLDGRERPASGGWTRGAYQ